MGLSDSLDYACYTEVYFAGLEDYSRATHVLIWLELSIVGE